MPSSVGGTIAWGRGTERPRKDALISTAAATPATAAVCWCLHSGFVLGRLGELAFTGQSRHDALVLAGCALGGILLASTLRASTEPHSEERVLPTIPRRRGVARAVVAPRVAAATRQAARYGRART